MRQILAAFRDPTMGKSSGWIYEGHAPLMAKRGRRGDKRRRLVGAVVILGLTLTVVMTARTASGGSSPSSIDDRFDDFATHGARFGGGSRFDEIRGDVRLHRFGSDADAASAATRASRAMDSMNSLTVGAAADRGVEMMRDHRRHEPSRGGGLRTTDHPIYLGIDDDVHRAVDFSHRPLVSHGGGWESQPSSIQNPASRLRRLPSGHRPRRPRTTHRTSTRHPRTPRGGSGGSGSRACLARTRNRSEASQCPRETDASDGPG